MDPAHFGNALDRAHHVREVLAVLDLHAEEHRDQPRAGAAAGHAPRARGAPAPSRPPPPGGGARARATTSEGRARSPRWARTWGGLCPPSFCGSAPRRPRLTTSVRAIPRRPTLVTG